jgi:multiple sugar transport system substrate-binding protein
MKFKRGMVVAAATIASVVALAGCSGTSSSPSSTPKGEKVTSIDYWYWQDDTTDTTIKNLALDFKKKTGITVNITDNVAQPQFYDKLVNAVAAGNAPDATHLNTNMMGQLINAKVLAPLDGMIKNWDGKDTIPDTMWAYDKSPDGKTTYALPNKFLMFYMYYRADIFKAEGVEVPKTQEEFVDAAKKLYDPSKNQYAFDIRGGANGQDQWAAFLTAGGAKFLDSKGDVAWDSKAAKKANDLYISTYKYAPPGAINDALPQLIANLQSGTATMIINHLGAAKTLQASLGDKVGVALIPSATGDPKKTTYMGTMNSNAVLASSKKQQAAFEWISFLDSEKAQVAITRSTNGYVPVTKSAAKNEEFTSNRYIAISLQAAKYSTNAWPNIPGTTAATTKTWQPLFQGALLGKNSNDAVVEGVANSLNTGQ